MVPSGEMHLPSGKTTVCPLMFLAPQVEGKMLLLNPQKGAWNAGVGRNIQGESGLLHCYRVAWPSFLFQSEEVETNFTCCLLWFGWSDPTATAQAHAAV